MGTWVSYGLGSLNENLPTFAAPDHRGFASNGTKNWTVFRRPSIRARSSVPDQTPHRRSLSCEAGQFVTSDAGCANLPKTSIAGTRRTAPATSLEARIRFMNWRPGCLPRPRH
jgi:hypothetical protein